MADELQWQAPTGRASASGATKLTADRLRERKDEWAIIEETPVPADEGEAKKARAQASNRASLISQGRLAAFAPAGVFEAASRSKDERAADGTPVIRVFARYRGEENAKPASAPAAEDATTEAPLSVGV